MTQGRYGFSHMALNPDVVDLVAVSPDGSQVDLVIVQEEPWSGTDEELMALQAKIHNYVGFAVDGQLVAAYPDMEGLPWRIIIANQGGTPDERTLAVLEALTDPVRAYGGDLVPSWPYGGSHSTDA